MKIMVHGNEIHYELEGPISAPVIMLSHALATNMKIWDPQMCVLTPRFRVLRYDSLGHGGTSVPAGPYTAEKLAEQAGDLLGALTIKKVHFVGLSMGGIIGQMLALMRPDAIASLVLVDSMCSIPPEAQPLWQERIKVALSDGMQPLVEPAIARWFTVPFRQAHSEITDRVRAMIRGTVPAGYAACCHAIAALDLAARIHAIQAPALILVGEEDPGTPVAMSRAIHERIAGSELTIIPSASHLCNTEQPDAFNRALLSFLDRVSRT
jgi:3-oxoadipate enol-lactonase